MTRRFAIAGLLLLSACATEGTPIRISGAYTSSTGGAGATARTMVVPAALTNTAQGTRLEMVTAEGLALSGLLRAEREPVVVPLSAVAATPLVGGATQLNGEISGGGTTLVCRFRLLNPVRGVDGGGSGRCEGGQRQVEFVF